MLQLRVPLPRFVSAGEVLGGAGSIGALRALDAARVAVLASPSVLSKHGELLKRSMGAEAVELIGMPRGEPALGKLAPVLAQMESFQPDWIVAVGGGSVLDGAKIAWIFYEHPAVDHDRIFRVGGVPTLRGKARLVAVPTTTGTGSEVSSSALLLDDRTGSKRALVSHDLLPDVAILDPRLAVGCPRDVIVNAGMDALAHAVESYVSRLKNPLADSLAEKAASEILSALPSFAKQPEDERLCEKMMNSSLLAGWVQNQKVPGVGHAIAHQLGGFGVAHGHATGRLLAPAITYNCQSAEVRQQYDSLANAVGLSSAEELAEKIRSLVETLEMPALDGKFDESMESIVTGAIEDPCARMNPLPVEAKAVEQILEASR
ncbi:MAG: iron-containing alcohol dehydrogenase [Verrucomicrobiota bacterium]